MVLTYFHINDTIYSFIDTHGQCLKLSFHNNFQVTIEKICLLIIRDCLDYHFDFQIRRGGPPTPYPLMIPILKSNENKGKKSQLTFISVNEVELGSLEHDTRLKGS